MIRIRLATPASSRTTPHDGGSRALPPELSCPRGRNGDDAGPSTRKLRVRVPPGVLIDVHLAVGELATPPASGAGDRRFDSCQPDKALACDADTGRAGSAGAAGLQRGRGEAVLASLMSSRPWVRIPPALLGGVAQRGEHPV